MASSTSNFHYNPTRKSLDSLSLSRSFATPPKPSSKPLRNSQFLSSSKAEKHSSHSSLLFLDTLPTTATPNSDRTFQGSPSAQDLIHSMKSTAYELRAETRYYVQARNKVRIRNLFSTRSKESLFFPETGDSEMKNSFEGKNCETNEELEKIKEKVANLQEKICLSELKLGRRSKETIKLDISVRRLENKVEEKVIYSETKQEESCFSKCMII
jgi:hypothetical protein